MKTTFRSRRLEAILRRMLTLNLLLPVVLATLLTGLAAGALAARALEMRQRALLQSLGERVTLELESNQRWLLAVARTGGSDEALSLFHAAAPQVDALYRLDGRGQLTAIQPPAWQMYVGMDFSNQVFAGQEGEWEKVSISAPATSPLTGKRVVYLTTPLADGGRLAAEISLETLRQWLVEGLKENEELKGVSLFDASGALLAYSGEVLSVEGGTGLQRMGSEWALVGTTRLANGWVVRTAADLSGGWVGFVPALVSLLLFVPWLCIWLVLRFGRQVSQLILRPLKLLNERTAQIARGDFSRWVSFDTVASSFQEVAELAASFQRMQQEVQQRQAALQVSETRFREMADLLPDMVFELDAMRRIRYANRAAVALLGEQETGNHQLFDRLLEPDELRGLQEIFRQAAAGKAPHHSVMRFRRPEGSTFPGEMAVSAQRGADGNLLGFRGVVRDITERLSFEETLRRSYQLFTEGPVVVFRVQGGKERRLEYVSPNVSQYGYSPHDFTGQEDFFRQVIHPEDRERVAEKIREQLAGKERFFDQEYRLVRADGVVRWVYDFTSISRDSTGQATYIDWYLLDITERKLAEERINTQLRQMAALQLVDASISANADLRITLDLLNAQLLELLGVDAAMVLRYNPKTQLLEGVAGRGLGSINPPDVRLRMGESYAGRAARQRRAITLTMPDGELARGFKMGQLAAERFVSYAALPLIAKDEVMGVLEVFSRAPLAFEPGWMDFLEMMAAQAAIAIDNANLLESLQRSNEELREAYEATIRGLSRALELRDKETEGHSQRVSDLTVRLARKAGVEEEAIEFIRIGALLHDIGKLGVPDTILHKEGQLTEAEWEIMRRHPDLARQMLATIEYLRPALVIPQYHHERWDGSGYPYGLAGEDIPLAARVFAVVDVWDALSFDRPYRSAWPMEKVIEYLVNEAGRQFDPRLVALFLEVLVEEAEANLEGKAKNDLKA